MELTDWLYVRYGKITPINIIYNQNKTKEKYNIKDSINILFEHMETGQELEIEGNLPFSYRQLAEMCI